jgi:hypothetical protein
MKANVASLALARGLHRSNGSQLHGTADGGTGTATSATGLPKLSWDWLPPHLRQDRRRRHRDCHICTGTADGGTGTAETELGLPPHLRQDRSTSAPGPSGPTASAVRAASARGWRRTGRNGASTKASRSTPSDALHAPRTLPHCTVLQPAWGTLGCSRVLQGALGYP